jgi:hypothetical protein
MATQVTLNSGSVDSAGSLLLRTNGTTTAVTVDTSQNVGVGVTPSAWASSWRAIQITGTSGNSGGSIYTNAGGTTGQIGVAQNWYWNGTNNLYLATAAASDYYQYAGTHVWRNAPSGTAGNTVTFTQAMTLNANGALALQGASTSATGVGITFPATQSASTDANTLDDYEEGTWTPAYSGITGSPTSIARYVKVGRQVTLTYEQTGGTFTCTGGSGTITGIPFLGVGSTGVVSACGTISNTAVTSALALYNASTTGSMYVTASFAAASGVGFSITYFV